MVYTQKGLEFRRTLKNEIDNEDTTRELKTKGYKKDSSKFRNINVPNLNSFLKGTLNESNSSFKLPDFTKVKVDIIKTARGEIKEKPLYLTRELDPDQNTLNSPLKSPQSTYFLTQYPLNPNSTSKLQSLLNGRPPNIHSQFSKNMILTPKAPLQSTSVVDILGSVESPSHWRYFENKSRMLSPSTKSAQNLTKNVHKSRHFSPEATDSEGLDRKYPFNVEKIFRKHAEEQEKRQFIR